MEAKDQGGATVVRGNDWVPRFCSNCGREIGRWGS